MRNGSRRLIIALILSCVTLTTAFAQTKVTGVVTDEKGVPLPGVTLLDKTSKAGVATDIDGKFSLNISANTTLEVKYIGYTTKDVAVQPGQNITVQLIPTNNDLEEVVVVAYGTQKKASVTGAISTVKSADLVRTPSIAATSALVGKVPGINSRTTDSRPGNGTSIQIRNLGNPLYVIDGVTYSTSNGTDGFGYNTGISGENAFNQLGLDDIESITVLKDASASIYGLAAGNGVILVTTKRGKKGEDAKINLSGYYGLQNFTRFPRPANAGQYIRGLAQSIQNLGGDPSTLYPADELMKWETQADKAHLNNDYYEFVTRPNVPQYNVSANVAGGSATSTYYLAVNHVSQDAIIKDFKFKRTNLQSNISSTIAKGFTVGAQLSGRLEDRHNVGVPGLDDFFNPLLSIGSMWPTEKAYANDNPLYINQTHNVNVNPATYKNDVTGYIDNITRAMSAKFNAQYDFKFGLSIKGLYSYDFLNEDFEGFEYTYPAYIYDETTGQYNDRAANGALYGNQNPWRETHKRNVISKFSQLQLNYAKKFGDHDISAVVAYERRESENKYQALHSVPPNNIIVTQLFPDVDYLGDSRYQEAFEGVASRINYSYKNKYLIEGVARYDGSFLYRNGSRFGFFPGVTAGWRITQEGFMKRFANTINDLKLRFSYGETGTSLQDGAGNYYAPGPFAYLGGYNTNAGSAVLDGTFYNGVVPRGIPTTTISWLRNKMLNVGFDFTVFTHFSGQFDVFRRTRAGFPAIRNEVVLPGEIGYDLPPENLNSDITQGLDGSIVYTNKVGQVDFSIGGNASLGRNKTDYVYRERFGNSYEQYRLGQAGRWTGVNFGHHIIGRFESQQQINDYPVNIDGAANTTLLPGDLIYEDLNGDGVINQYDERPIGYAEGALPYFNYGVNGRVSYKGISLAFDFAGATMQTFYRDYELKYPFQNNGNSPTYMLTDAWHRADLYDPNSAWLPGTYPALRKDNNNLSIFRVPNALSNKVFLPGRNENDAPNFRNDFWTTNINYFRLKNLQLGYTFPQNIIKKMGLSALRVYVTGTNLFSFDNVKGYQIDPEISAINGLAYPQQKIYTFGFNLTL
ncbi:TonB-dependent receptor [Mucilaginibacter gynuensis]|uniref:TonB-dependent receptor n=1 Tax=Mucilaginibacter gynuensis TaxID=1302236 RepID=A0ABP8G2B2_9SPHI